MKIQIIVGSTREGRMSERVAKWVNQSAKARASFEVELVDLADYPLALFAEPISPRYNPNRQPNAATAKWLDKLSQADGYIIVTPEYNHSISGVLKNALDHIDYQLAKKPVAIVSHGVVGGARAAEHLKAILLEAKAAVVPEALALLGRPEQQIEPDGTYIGDKVSPYNPQNTLNGLFTELTWWTSTLMAGKAVVAK